MDALTLLLLLIGIISPADDTDPGRGEKPIGG
jgi:hypothetical protein